MIRQPAFGPQLPSGGHKQKGLSEKTAEQLVALEKRALNQARSRQSNKGGVAWVVPKGPPRAKRMQFVNGQFVMK